MDSRSAGDNSSMATKTFTKTFSDLSDKEIRGDGGGTVKFGFDGRQYEIDLTATEKAEFAKTIGKYVDAGRSVGRATRGRTPGAKKSTTHSASDIRAWAVEQGIDIPARGRIPADIREQYEAAH